MRTFLPSLITVLALAAHASAAPPALKVFPPTIELRGQEDRQSLVVQFVDAQGTTKDVTTTAKLSVADPAVVALSGQTLAPKKDGKTKLLIEAAGVKTEIAVTVT